MKSNRRYLAAVALLFFLALVFGAFGTVAPPLAEEMAGPEPQQESSTESIGHFQNPPTYDSGWMSITTKPGQHVNLGHNLNTSSVFVDITGKRALDPMGGALAWSRIHGEAGVESATSVVQASDGGYALAGFTNSSGAGKYDFWLVKTNSIGNILWEETHGGSGDDMAYSMVQTDDEGYVLAGATRSFGAGGGDFWLVKTDSYGSFLWSKTYGGAGLDWAFSVVQTFDGGYALAGYTYSFGAGNYDFWLVKTDSAGNLLWEQTYGGAGLDWAYSMVQTDDEGYAIAGLTYSYGAGGSDAWLVKTNSAGEKLWSKTYGGGSSESANSVVQASDGGYALAGYKYSSVTVKNDFWLVKTDSAGTMQWSQTYGGTNNDNANSVVQTFDGGYALAGDTTSFGSGGRDSWLVRTDLIGTQLWNATYGGAGSEEVRSLVQTDDGGYVAAGYTYSYGAGYQDMWLVRVNEEMNREHQRNLGGTNLIPGWSRTYGGGYSDIAYSVVQTTDGGYALAGSTESYDAGFANLWLAKTDASGDVQWSKVYGGSNADYANCVVQTFDGGYVIAGTTGSYGAGSWDFWLVKTDSAGGIQWSQTYGGATSDIAYSVVQTLDGGYAIAGKTTSHGVGLDDFWLVKTNPSGTMQWSQTYGGTENDDARSVVQTFDGGYALAGYTYSFGAGNYDFWLVKTDSAGTMQWSQTYGGGSPDLARSVVQTFDGGYALAGETASYGSLGANFWLVRTDATGNHLWNKTYGGRGIDIPYSGAIQTTDGGYAMAGYTNSYGFGSDDFWLVKTDSVGNMQWSQTYGGSNLDWAYSVVQTFDGGYALAGYTYSFGAGNYDFWLVKTDVELGLTWTDLTSNSITLYRGKTDLYWNYVRVCIWLIKEPSWIYGDINMDGIVDSKDLYIIGRNYGKTFSLLSLTGIIAVAGIHTVKKRRQNKQPSYIS